MVETVDLCPTIIECIQESQLELHVETNPIALKITDDQFSYLQLI